MDEIERICEGLKARAFDAGRPFLAHLLDMVVVESRTRRDLPIESLLAIAEDMRMDPELVRMSATAGERTWSNTTACSERNSF